MMHHVRKGALWVYEERERLLRIGSDSAENTRASPYPSAWRAQGYPGENVPRRAGSLRVPAHSESRRPRLGRMTSEESLRASEDMADGTEYSPSANQIWAKWAENPLASGTARVVAELLAEDGEPDASDSLSRTSSIRSARAPSRQSSLNHSPVSGGASTTISHVQPYSDGSPGMKFLDGVEPVPEDVRLVIKAMLSPSPEERPSASELARLWVRFGCHL